ncbi:MAG: RNA polymerase recycling motor HelD [Clostridiales bacterium]|nr:RNA polymerase recycling motor HelD [Clostridiales bacterium]
MPAAKHPDYKEELERLKYTLHYVEKSLDASAEEKLHMDEDVAKRRRHFDSADSESYIGLMVNTMLQDRINLRIKNLKMAGKRPYFARIDFKEDGKDVPEKLYIGKMVLIRDEDQELIIVDWRAPVANLYYEARLGEAAYTCPDGKIKGRLSLKRQFSIDEGRLNEIFDIDITTNDEFLQTYLGANADNRLKDIVSTIQVEQNRIIRADMWKPLIVQGAAGSGKTTIALHRIAYLIYTYEKRFNPENFMIIAPNRLFLNYISGVLPELGVEKVKQTTFQDFAMELIGGKFKIRDSNEKLVLFVNGKDREYNEIIKKDSELKSSIVFKNILDDYLSIIEKDFIPHEDFKILQNVIFKYEEINRLFLVDYKHEPFMKRVKEIKKHLTNALKRKKDSLVQKFQDQCDFIVENLKFTMEDCAERHELIVNAIDYKNESIKNLETISKKAVKEYIAGISKANPFKYYKSFITDGELFGRLCSKWVDEKYIEPIRKYSEDIIRSGSIEIEDLAPIIYIKFRIYGMDEKIPVKHIVVDEAQDFSVFQFYVIRNIIKDSSFTILGDLCQGIHSYRGVKDWNDVIKYAFENRECQLLNLEQSYRTTVEIMDAANKVLSRIKDKNLPPGRPVIRHGEKVGIIKRETVEETALDIESKVKSLREDNYKSIAVICKTMNECEDIFGLLKKIKDGPYIIKGTEKQYKGGFVIVPSYLSKGLEFDAVMIVNADDDVYKENELDAKLLYVAMTRPLHKLYIYHRRRLSHLLKDV